MAYFVKTPDIPATVMTRLQLPQTYPRYANIINSESTIDQRELRRSGYAKSEPDTVSTFLNVCAYLVEKEENISLFDIGSNSGMYSIAAKLKFPDNVLVHAFEPAEEAFH